MGEKTTLRPVPKQGVGHGTSFEAIQIDVGGVAKGAAPNVPVEEAIAQAGLIWRKVAGEEAKPGHSPFREALKGITDTEYLAN